MKAVCWYGKNTVEVETVPDPGILNPRDAIIKITATAICGSDLHLYDGYIPTMKRGDILGHEPMGVVVEIGKEVKKLQPGDRVVVPFTISCGKCFFCQSDQWSLCDNTNPNAWMAETLFGTAPAGRLGSLFAKMLGRDPAGELREGLRRFKQVMETGEMATTDGQSAGHAGLAKLRK